MFITAHTSEPTPFKKTLALLVCCWRRRLIAWPLDSYSCCLHHENQDRGSFVWNLGTVGDR